jgi:hypothetical protein
VSVHDFSGGVQNDPLPESLGFFIFAQEVVHRSDRLRRSPRFHFFEVTLTGHTEQIHPPALDVIEITKAALDPRHDAAEGALAGAERLRAVVLAIHREQVERHEERPLPPEQLVLEVAGAVRLQAADFLIQDGRVRPHEWALSSASCGQDSKGWPLREMSAQRWPLTCASALKPSILGSKVQSVWSNGSGRGGDSWV